MPQVSNADEVKVFGTSVADPHNTVVVIAADQQGRDREIFDKAESVARPVPYHAAFWIVDLALIQDHVKPDWELEPGRYVVIGCADRRVTGKGTNDSLRELNKPSWDRIMGLFDDGDAACTGADQ